ncbi:L-lactate dehydrogenase complex protein LldG [Bacillus oleivorans]|uniref:Lactate utilization protein C n=1 Tax=Bacillus oleivorans TaxID=1448271 RepID=A0A285CYW1_9BACI|nr:lactate utilization protein C [Bacillus oleivorans]SNX72767.1 L-lactate dehydrogenase complex protein LldG [Bacillus oleivorans]
MTRGMIYNRENFLNHIAGELGRERKKEVTRPEKQYQPQLKVFAKMTPDQLLEELIRACERIHTEVFVTNAASIEKTLKRQIEAYGGGPIVTAEDLRFFGFGLGMLLEQENVHKWDPSLGKENIEIAEKANIGIMFSDITLAESGTVVILNNKNKARAISLLPTTFIAIIPKSTIVPRFTQAAQEIERRMQTGQTIASCINFISGPSNSADIEYNLVVGVHGPIRVSYIVVEDR